MSEAEQMRELWRSSLRLAIEDAVDCSPLWKREGPICAPGYFNYTNPDFIIVCAMCDVKPSLVKAAVDRLLQIPLAARKSFLKNITDDYKLCIRLEKKKRVLLSNPNRGNVHKKGSRTKKVLSALQGQLNPAPCNV